VGKSHKKKLQTLKQKLLQPSQSPLSCKAHRCCSWNNIPINQSEYGMIGMFQEEQGMLSYLGNTCDSPDGQTIIG